MSAASVLARGRRAAERLMVDTCTIRRRTGETTGPGGVVEATYDVLYTGPCRVQQQAPSASPQDAGEDYALMLALTVQLPMSVTGLRTEDEITIDTSAHDPDLPGRVFVVKDLAHKSHATARRVGVVERS
ncbi:DUF6093 family protein [Plantactinospora solaniradicis]|uniref:DUF6093 family protein n=1 Tax=Plantactinospora solaniradicis TaxID=1723736 RepID=A0ABW1K7I6_9ACTN